ncbi:hypothetical protein R1flu_010083 [Riccia fluitans]|uniref:Uracil-DNA glycosylase n=1 Tax=Riccia fluitans TaxID=41844 RepID=A0ABD1Z4B3_9MARC
MKIASGSTHARAAPALASPFTFYRPALSPDVKSGKLASISILSSSFHRCSLFLERNSSMVSSKGKNTIAACFQTAKRVRVNAGVNTARVSGADPGAEPTSGDEAADGSKKLKIQMTAVQAHTFMDGSDSSKVGVEEDKIEDESGNTGGEGEAAVASEEEGSQLNKEQRMRMELNKGIARAKRNLKTCENTVAQVRGEGKSFPEFKMLLVEPTWLAILQEEFSKSYMSKLQSFVEQEAKGANPIYPPPALVFNAFNTCPFDKIKVVIIGQDPYHGPNQAMGLCFSIPQGVKVPSSLLNIFKEIHDDIGCSLPSHGNLEKWAHQGVFLLNAVLTVRQANPNSHAKKGWETFTDVAIRAVSQQRAGVVFLLWGNSAQDKARLIDSTKHHILKAAHPSGLSANRGFFKCRHFSKTNELLEKAGEVPIDWQL